MGFLTGLFSQTVPELVVADVVLGGNAIVEPGYLYRLDASDAPITLTLATRAVSDVSGKRFAVKVFTRADTPPGGTLTILAPEGQQLEADTGELGTGVVLPNQAVGTYREWLCDTLGNWLLISGGWSSS